MVDDYGQYLWKEYAREVPLLIQRVLWLFSKNTDIAPVVYKKPLGCRLPQLVVETPFPLWKPLVAHTTIIYPCFLITDSIMSPGI